MVWLLAIDNSEEDEASDKDKSYKPRRRAASEESVRPVQLDENGDEVMSDCSPTKPTVHNYLIIYDGPRMTSY